jgi:hypothetical protein
MLTQTAWLTPKASIAQGAAGLWKVSQWQTAARPGSQCGAALETPSWGLLQPSQPRGGPRHSHATQQRWAPLAQALAPTQLPEGITSCSYWSCCMEGACEARSRLSGTQSTCPRPAASGQSEHNG